MNAVRVLAQCEEVAAQMQTEGLASERSREELDGPADEEGASASKKRRKTQRVPS